jgi:AmmeMemoRadiSam system protein B
MEEDHLLRRRDGQETARGNSAGVVFPIFKRCRGSTLMGRVQAASCLFLLVTIPAGMRTLHYSWWSDNPQPYLDAIQRAGPTSPPKLLPKEKIRAGIVTHHFLASAMMVRFFAGLSATTSPETIILIGPNHFHRGLADVSVSSLPWKTPFGIVETDRRVAQLCMNAIHLPEHTEAFTGEHSVGVLIPFLKYYFPDSRVVLILVDTNAQQRHLRDLRGAMTKLLGNPRMLVLLSMDFSHNSVANIADKRDAQAHQVISDLELDKVEGLNVDCRKGLWVLLASLIDLQQVKVLFSEHTNSARVVGDAQQSDVTSYYSVYFYR